MKNRKYWSKNNQRYTKKVVKILPEEVELERRYRYVPLKFKDNYIIKV